jgi:hypothetical protein
MIVEDYVGFKRKEAEYRGSWAMATFVEATETSEGSFASLVEFDLKNILIILEIRVVCKDGPAAS